MTSMGPGPSAKGGFAEGYPFVFGEAPLKGGLRGGLKPSSPKA